MPSSPGGNNIDGPPSVNHSLPHGVSNLQEALAKLDKENKNASIPGGRRKRRRKSRRKSRKKKGGAPVYGISMLGNDPKKYTYDEAKERKIKHIWEASKDGVQVKDPYGFDAFKPQATDELANKKSLSKKGGKKRRRKSRRKSRKKKRKSRKGKKKLKTRRKKKSRRRRR